MDKKQLIEMLHREIPMSRFMQVEIITIDEKLVELACDLEPNHNHLGTAFGGSLSCLMILAAYCQIFRMINSSGHVLLKSGSMEFFCPVEEQLHAICKPPSPKEIETFLKNYNKKGKARLHLESSIVLSDGRVACTMKTEFVGTNS